MGLGIVPEIVPRLVGGALLCTLLTLQLLHRHCKARESYLVVKVRRQRKVEGLGAPSSQQALHVLYVLQIYEYMLDVRHLHIHMQSCAPADCDVWRT
jgi:hypothetical protein